MHSSDKYFIYSKTETDYLSSKDKKLSQAIELIGSINRQVTPDLFKSLINSIVGQQISTKAQVTIWKRMNEFCGEITAPALLIPARQIQSFGITMRKAEYIRAIAEKVCSGELDLGLLHSMPDEGVIKQLTGLPGIGVWTAEMLMIFSMQRRDIFSFGDLAIHRGLRMLYRHKEIKRDRFEMYRRRYSPYGSVASLYLWEIASGRWSEFKDTI